MAAVARRRGSTTAFSPWEASGDGTFLREVDSGHSSWFDALSVSPDENVLAAGGGDHLVRLWQIAGEGVLAPLPPLRGHDASVTSLAWSPDGRLLASGSSDGSVRLWDTATWQAVAVLRGHDRGGEANAVNSVLFSADGEHLFTAGNDGAVQSWPTGAQRLLEIARRKVLVATGRPTLRAYRDLAGRQDWAAARAMATRLVETATQERHGPWLDQIAWAIVDPTAPAELRDLDLAERAILRLVASAR